MLENQLLQDTNLAQVLFEQAPIGLGISNMQGKLLTYNKMLLQISGFTPEDIEKINSVADLYYDPTDRDTILKNTMEKGFTDKYPVKFKKKDGSFFESLFSLRRILIHGEPHWLALIQDVSEQNASEQKMQETIKELEAMNEMMINRELKMAELKSEIDELKQKLKQ